MARGRRLASAEDIDEQTAMENIAVQDPAPGTRRVRKAATGNRGNIPARTATGRIRSKAETVKNLRDEIEFFLTMGQAGWSLRDEECASSATPERIATMADAMASMAARNDKLLNYVAKSGVIGDIVRLLSAAVPIAIAVAKAHGPTGRGHQLEDVRGDDAFAFPAYAG